MKREPLLVKELLKKAKDSALLAVEFYNKPAVSFKSEGFITMMIIGWTALFHAWFIKNKIKPYYRKGVRYETIKEKLPDGQIMKEKRWWDISECIKQYFKNENPPVRKNLEFFVQLRNMIAHRNLPELDAPIFGECQALLLNFNNFLEKKFGEKHSIKNLLSFSLQMARSPQNLLEASKEELKRKKVTEIVDFIKAFRSSLATDVIESLEYSFKAILIQVKNHESKDALPIKFIHEKELNEELRRQLTNIIVLIKEKEIIKDDIPKGFLAHGELIEQLRKVIKEFKPNKKFYQIRSEILSKNPSLVYIRKLDPKNEKSPQKNFTIPKL